MARALITGITGQDGAYLADLLLDLGYEVFGAYRRSSGDNLWRLRKLGIQGEIEYVPFDLLEYENIKRTIDKVKPDEIYNLAAQSFVAESFEQPQYTVDVNGLGVLRILEAIRGKDIRMYQASTSEMFGQCPAPQNERTPFVPRSPYGCGKLLAHSLCVNYRESYGMPISCGILFNHESELRGSEFVTQKIARDIWTGKIILGNLDAKRDWGHAKDYVRAMWMMLQHEPDDFVIATGTARTVREFVDVAALCAGITPTIEIDPKFYRPAEVDYLQGDYTKALMKLGWKPEITFNELVSEMVQEGYNESS
jgi:GDPmannose 4,6-dehydratase